MESKIRMAGNLADIVTCAKFQDEIFRGYDSTGGRISHFPIDFCMGLTTVQRDCAACNYAGAERGAETERGTEVAEYDLSAERLFRHSRSVHMLWSRAWTENHSDSASPLPLLRSPSRTIFVL